MHFVLFAFVLLTNPNGPRLATATCNAGEYTHPTTGLCTPCPLGSYCDGTSAPVQCPANSNCPEGSDDITDCTCTDGYYGADGSACLLCPNGTHAPGGVNTVDECTCYLGTHGSVLAGIPNCQTCSTGQWCPGDGTAYTCPNNQRTEPLTGATSQSDCKAAVCGNGILEGDEECDDGSPEHRGLAFSGDGCDGYCKFEDQCNCANGSVWYCQAQPWVRTECCQTLTNPVTQELTCDCKEQVSDDPGYIILDDCSKRDIDECANNYGGCVADAVCTNFDGVLKAGTHECKCPPGLVGDGYNRCDVFIFETVMEFELQGMRREDIVTEELKENFTTHWNVFPGRSVQDITIVLDEYTDSALERPENELRNPLFETRRRATGLAHEHHASSRHLLQGRAYGVHMKVNVISQNALDMEDLTSVIDENGVTTLLADWYNVAVRILQGPQNAVQTVDRVYGAINTVLTGFQVEGIVYNTTSLEWLITVHYVGNSPNTVTSLYVTKSDTPPYSETTEDSFYIAKHPCMKSRSVCCLADYAEDYYIGDFATNITTEVGSCDNTVRNRDTLDMFHPGGNDDILMNSLSDLPNSYVTRLDANRLQLHINRFALRDQVAMREAFAGGYNMDFFVGMSYYTLLPTNSLATVASQVDIHATATDALVFATSSEQDYTFLEYITMALFQTKYVHDLVSTHYMQYVRLGFVFPETLTQNMETGLVPLTGMRFAIAKTAPDVMDDNLWTNPCFSEDGSGLYDNATSSLREMYELSQHQKCSLQVDFCQNPTLEVLDTGHVEIWFPIGDERLTDAILEAGDQYHLFVYFNIAVKYNGKKSFTKMFAQAPLSQLSLTRACEELSAAQTIGDIAEIDLNIGIAGTEADWVSSVSQFTNLLRETETNGILNTGLSVQARSVESGLITIAVRGSPELFENPLAQPFHFEIEDMTSVHFLEDSKYQAMLALVAAGNAWSMVREETTGYLQLALSFAATNMCLAESVPGDFSCAVRKNIYRRQVVWEHAVHPLATGVNTNDEGATVAWLQEFILGNTDFTRNLAMNFTRLTRQKHKINDRYNKAWFLNPMYRWAMDENAPAQSALSLSDKTVIAAILVMEDGNYAYGSGGGVRRRMLLQVAQDADGGVTQSLRELGSAGDRSTLPPLKNTAVTPDYEIARMIGIDKKKWGKARMRVKLQAPSSWTAKKVRDDAQLMLNLNKPSFSKGADFVHVVQFLLEPDQRPSTSRQLLQAGGGSDTITEWEGYLNTMFVARDEYFEENNLDEDVTAMSVYTKWLRCAFYLGNITVDRYGSPSSECGEPLPTNEHVRGFIEQFWVETCNNRTEPGARTECYDVFNVTDDNDAIANPVVIPQAPAGLILGFEVTLTFIGPFITSATFNAYDKLEVAKIIGEKLQVQDRQVQVVEMRDGRATRRLLDLTTKWEVRVDDDYRENTFPNLDLSAKQTEIRQAIETRLNYQVEIALVDVLTAGEEEEGGLSTTILIVIIAVAVVVLLVAAALVYYWCFMLPAAAKKKRAEEEQGKNKGAGVLPVADGAAMYHPSFYGQPGPMYHAVPQYQGW